MKFQCGKVAAKPYYYYYQKFHLHLIRPCVLVKSEILSQLLLHHILLCCRLHLGYLLKKKQQQLYAFGASASYTEIKRYKILAAATTNFLELELNGNQELTQGVCGNYDTNVTSQNGLKTTHSLATIITQPINDDFLDQKPVVS